MVSLNAILPSPHQPTTRPHYMGLHYHSSKRMSPFPDAITLTLLHLIM